MLDQGQKTESPSPPSGPEQIGRYELVERLGEGGAAEVYLARRLGVLPFQRPVAVVKRVWPELARNQQFIDSLLDEARISALIKHPRVIDVYDVGVSRGIYFIATEHLMGQSLQTLVARSHGAQAARGTGGFLDVYSTARIIADAADGLHAAHEQRSLTGRPLQLVHRDVTPKNIVVLYDGSVKVVDVGIARAWAAAPERPRMTGYQAPEQLDRGAVDRRADIFSLGVVMWEALAGVRLFDGSTTRMLGQIARGEVKPPSAHRPEVPDALDRICLRALAGDPAERFQTAGEMRAALESLLDDTSFRRSSGALAAFMGDLFDAERRIQQQQVDRATDAPVRPAERRRAPSARPPAVEGEVADTLVRMPDELIATGLAMGNQHISPPGSDESDKPLVPRPDPLPRDGAAARRRASAALAAVARSAPLPPVDSEAGDGPVARSESPVAPGSSAPPTDTTVPGSAGAVSDAGAPAGAAAAVDTGEVGRPRGKGRSSRIDSIADAWTDRRARPSGRSLPLPAPPKVALGTESDASITGVGADPEEDDDDFTFVDPERSMRSFESITTGTADRTGTTKSLVLDNSIKPILRGHRSRRIWAAAIVAVGATGVVCTLLYTALGDVRREQESRGQGATLPPEAQRPLSVTAAPSSEANQAPSSEASQAPSSEASQAPSSEASQVPAEPAASASLAESASPAASPSGASSSAASSSGEMSSAPAPASAASAGSPASPSPRESPSPSSAPDEERPARSSPRIASAAKVTSGSASRTERATARSRQETRAEDAGRMRPAPARTPARAEPTDSPDDLYRDGARLYLDGKLDEARRKFQTAIEDAPRFAPAHRGLGLVYERMGQNGRAVRAWQTYLRIAPGAPDADLVRARIERLSR